jgi:hypothetical protein
MRGCAIEYVGDFVPARTGERFEPHITVGRASNENARRLPRQDPSSSIR